MEKKKKDYMKEILFMLQNENTQSKELAGYHSYKEYISVLIKEKENYLEYLSVIAECKEEELEEYWILSHI